MNLIKGIVKRKLDRLIPVHMNRQGAFHMAWGHIYNNRMRGDYAEFGVYRGDSLIQSYAELQKFVKWNNAQLKSDEEWRRVEAKKYSNYKPIFYGFDTFTSMPDNHEGFDSYAGRTFQTSLGAVKKAIDPFIPIQQYQLVVGKFGGDSKIPTTCDSLAVVNIDSDLYESALSALAMCESRLQVGTVILFDEFHGFNADPQKGERKALAEFLMRDTVQVDRWFDYHLSGRAFLVTGLSPK
jgi:O-methyltransferase